ncbi:MAG: small subunit ribosomal protein S21 [Cryomorphaceae bacterium]
MQPKIEYRHMLIIPVKEGENIERALKKFKKKYDRTGVVKELRRRQQFTKPSVLNRKEKLKAIYVNKMYGDND